MNKIRRRKKYGLSDLRLMEHSYPVLPSKNEAVIPENTNELVSKPLLSLMPQDYRLVSCLPRGMLMIFCLQKRLLPKQCRTMILLTQPSLQIEGMTHASFGNLPFTMASTPISKNARIRKKGKTPTDSICIATTKKKPNIALLLNGQTHGLKVSEG